MGRRRVHVCFETSNTLRRNISARLVNHVRSSPSWKPDLGNPETMKPSRLLPLAAAASAVSGAVLPGASAAQSPVSTYTQNSPGPLWLGAPAQEGGLSSLDGMVDSIGGALFHAANAVTRAGRRVMGFSSVEEDDERSHTATLPPAPQQAYGYQKVDVGAGGDGLEGRSIAEVIQESEHALYFAGLLGAYDKLQDMLGDNDKKGEAEFTVLVPTDEAFRRLEGFERSDGRLLGDILEYHVLEGRYPVDKLRGMRTVPTSLKEDDFGRHRQRLRIADGPSGVEVNFYGRVLASNSRECKNGIVHFVDDVLIPPPRLGTLMDALPEQLGVFSRAMKKTGLDRELHVQGRRGVTVFAPSDAAWRKLGDEVKGFLFSDDGLPYLAALTRYHVLVGETVYTDAYEGGTPGEGDGKEPVSGSERRWFRSWLEGVAVSVEIGTARESGPMMVNGAAVSVRDVPARDGVVHFTEQVLLPSASQDESSEGGATAEGVGVEELKRRLERFVKREGGTKTEEL